jgi:hypothetical protein
MSRAPSIAARRCASVASTVPTRARRTNRARGAAASRNADAETNAETDDRRDSRRAFLARACAGTACARASSSQASEARAPSGYDAPTVAPSGSTTRANAFESSRAGGESISPYAYRLRWPSGWCALRDLASARTVGVDASFKDPLDEASTLAVFVTRGVRERDVASRYGTLDEDARRRADAAPNQKTIGKRIVRVSVPRGDGAGRVVVEAHEIETEVGGGTAGRFGAAVELIRVWVADGSEWCVRATASKSAWPRVRGELRRAVDSFEFACPSRGVRRS